MANESPAYDGYRTEDNSSKLIQNQLFLVDDLAALTGQVKVIKEQLLTIMNQNATIERKQDVLLSRKLHSSTNTRTRKRKPKADQPKGKKGRFVDWAHLLHLPAALQANITKFTSDFLFEPTDFPDKLISEDCLSEDECETILSKSNTVDQVRLLIKKIKGRGPEKVEKFLNVIEDDYPKLVSAVRETLKTLIDKSKVKPHCAYCILRKTVDLKDIADPLWESRLIPDEIYGSIIEADTTNTQEKWSYVVHFINNAKDPDAAKEVMEKSLELKYGHLVKPFNEHRDPNTVLSCKCSSRRLHRQRNASVGSQTDMSTYSDYSYHKSVPNLHFLESESSSECFSTVESQDLESPLHSLTYADLKRFDDVDMGESCMQQKGKGPVEDAPASPDTTTPDCDMLLQAQENSGQRSRHTSGKFQPEGHDGLELDQCTSLPYVNGGDEKNSPEATAVFNDCNKPDFERSISNVTVIPAPKRSSSDDTLVRTSDTAVSPDTDKKMLTLSSANNVGLKESGITSPEQKDHTPKIIVPKLKLRRRNRRAYRQKDSSSCDGDDDDEDDQHALNRKRHKPFRRKFLERQKSAPAGKIVTPSRTMTDSTVGTRVITPRCRKETEKRAKRRLRAKQRKDKTEANDDPSSMPTVSKEIESETRAPSSPYNPNWGRHAQQRHTIHWDHNQARRYWRMAQLLAASDSRTQFYSDSDLKTEDSDGHNYTEYTV